MKFHIIFIALILFILISTYSDKIVYKSKTGFPIVLKNNVCIYMTSSKNLNDVHSSMNINNQYVSNNKYELYMLSGLLLIDKPQNYLLIGLGGGFTAKNILKLLPYIKLDIVEFNEEIVHVSQKYFKFKPSNDTRIYINDGCKHIMDLSLKKKYDIISIDAFNDNGYIPECFLNDILIKKIKQVLSLNGIFIINSISEAVIVKKLLQKNFKYYICITISNNKTINDVNIYNNLIDDKYINGVNYIYIASMTAFSNMNITTKILSNDINISLDYLKNVLNQSIYTYKLI